MRLMITPTPFPATLLGQGTSSEEAICGAQRRKLLLLFISGWLLIVDYPQMIILGVIMFLCYRAPSRR